MNYYLTLEISNKKMLNKRSNYLMDSKPNLLIQITLKGRSLTIKRNVLKYILNLFLEIININFFINSSHNSLILLILFNNLIIIIILWSSNLNSGKLLLGKIKLHVYIYIYISYVRDKLDPENCVKLTNLAVYTEASFIF